MACCAPSRQRRRTWLTPLSTPFQDPFNGSWVRLIVGIALSGMQRAMRSLNTGHAGMGPRYRLKGHRVHSLQPGQPGGDRELGRVDCPEHCRQLVGRRRAAEEEALTVVAVELDQR